MVPIWTSKWFLALHTLENRRSNVITIFFCHTLHKKWSFRLRISSVNVTKSSGNCGFGHIYWKIFTGKLQFLCSVILDNYSSSYEKILEKSGKFSMVVKRKYKLCIEISKTPNNLNSSFMKEIFELRLCSRPAREQYKLNLNIPRKRQVTFWTKSLESLGPKI